MEIISKNSNIFSTFNTVKRINLLFTKIDKKLKMQAAKKIKQFKRYAIYFEEWIRAKIARAKNFTRGIFDTDGLLEILEPEEVINIVNAYKNLQP